MLIPIRYEEDDSDCPLPLSEEELELPEYISDVLSSSGSSVTLEASEDFVSFSVSEFSSAALVSASVSSVFSVDSSVSFSVSAATVVTS